MRHFTDSTGVRWTVFEVKRGETQARWSYLPAEFGEGWLCFESNFRIHVLARDIASSEIHRPSQAGSNQRRIGLESTGHRRVECQDRVLRRERCLRK